MANYDDTVTAGEIIREILPHGEMDTIQGMVKEILAEVMPSPDTLEDEVNGDDAPEVQAMAKDLAKFLKARNRQLVTEVVAAIRQADREVQAKYREVLKSKRAQTQIEIV